MGSRSIARSLAGLALVALAAALVAIPASASNRPALTVTPSVSGASADIGVDVNRASHQIAECSFVLDENAEADCGSPTDTAKKSAAYDIGLTGLAGGSHTVVVTVVLTDGGGASGSATFEVVAGPVVFALAFSNLDGVAGYDPTNDVLIAKLVDTNLDNVVDAGDTVVTDRYPTNFGATAFGTFTVTSHDVANVLVATKTQAVVSDASGRQYSLQATDTSQRYLESTGTGTPSQTSIFDSIGGADLLLAQTGSPSHPDTAVNPRIIGGDAADDAFIDVAMNMP